MFEAMPSPVKIYYGAESELACPLTVREGRNWLSEYFEGREIKTDSLPEEEPMKEDETPALTLKEVWFRYEKTCPDVLKGVSRQRGEGEPVCGCGRERHGQMHHAQGHMRHHASPTAAKCCIEGKCVSINTKADELFKDNAWLCCRQDPQSLFVKKDGEGGSWRRCCRARADPRRKGQKSVRLKRRSSAM